MVPVAGVEAGPFPRKQILSTTTENRVAMLLESKEIPSKRPLMETNWNHPGTYSLGQKRDVYQGCRTVHL